MSPATEVRTFEKEAVPLLRSGRAMKKTVLELSLKRYQQRLQSFEQQHAMDSDKFVERFGGGGRWATTTGSRGNTLLKPAGRRVKTFKSWKKSSYDRSGLHRSFEQETSASMDCKTFSDKRTRLLRTQSFPIVHPGREERILAGTD